MGFFGTPWRRPWALASWSRCLDPRPGTWRRADRTQRTRSPRFRPRQSPRVGLHREIEQFRHFVRKSAKIIFRRNSLFNCKRKLKVLYVLPVHFTVLLILDIFLCKFFRYFRKHAKKLDKSVSVWTPTLLEDFHELLLAGPEAHGAKDFVQIISGEELLSQRVVIQTDHIAFCFTSLQRICSYFCLPLPACLLPSTCVPHRPLFCCVSVDFFCTYIKYFF